GGDFSLNAQIREDGDSSEWQDRLVDEDSDEEMRLADSEEFEKRGKALKESLSILDDRERRIIEARWLADAPITLDKLAVEFRISAERVRQIEVRAFRRLQSTVKLAIARRRPSDAIH